MKQTLKINNHLDKHLNQLKSEKGEKSSLELATEGNGARISGDLEVTGYTDNIKLRSESIIQSDGNVTLDSSGDITLDAAGADIAFATGGTSYLTWSANGVLTMKAAVDVDDHFQITVTNTGLTVISTNDDSDGNLADLSLDIEGDITLNSGNGIFIQENAGTEFSAANSAYAGMLLGCSHVFGSGTGGVFQSVTTAWESLLWDTDKYALVTFVVPPSNRVKISVQLPWIIGGGNLIQLGLATDSSATTLNTKYENDVDDANRSDSFSMNYSWVVEGSDHSWSAGETKTLYIMAYASSTTRFYTGGTNTGGYGGVIVEAIALPATIGDGSEP